jgi:hypothetical protein
MGTQGTDQALTASSFNGTASNINSGYATISFTIPEKAVNGSIWCQHIEFWAPNDLGGHQSTSTRGYPTWDGSASTRGEVCVKAVVPVHTPDSFINNERGPVYVRPGDDFEFEHYIDVDRPALNDGMGIYQIDEETDNGATGQCIWDKNNGALLSNSTFLDDPVAGHNSNLDNNHATVPCTVPDEDPEGATYCENINFWTSIDGNIPVAFDNNHSWGRSKMVCAIVRIPDLKITKTASKTSLERDEEFTYTVVVTNTDELIDTKGLIRVTDDVPEGIQLLGATSSDMDCVVKDNSFTCDTLEVLDPEEANNFTITVAAKAVGKDDLTSFTNYAFVGGGGDPTCPVGTQDPKCSDNAIVEIPPAVLPPKTGALSGTGEGTHEDQSIFVAAGLVLTVGSISALGVIAKRRLAKK